MLVWLGFLRFGRTRLSRRTSLGRRASTSEMRAPVAQRTRSSKRSRSQRAAAMTARTSSGARPSGGCQCFAPDRTERGLLRESDSSRAPRTARTVLGGDAGGDGMVAGSYTRRFLSDSPAPLLRDGLDRIGASLHGSAHTVNYRSRTPPFISEDYRHRIRRSHTEAAGATADQADGGRRRRAARARDTGQDGSVDGDPIVAI